MKPKPKPAFSPARSDLPLEALIQKTDKRTLAIWAADCARRVLPYFTDSIPEDDRPAQALRTLQAWIETGTFRMADIRTASLDAHAAARAIGEDTPARSVARAAGQAVATAHAAGHAPASARYAQQAVFRAADEAEAEAAVKRERDWQYAHLLKLLDKETVCDR